MRVMYSLGIRGSWCENTFWSPTSHRSIWSLGSVSSVLLMTWNSIMPRFSSRRAASSREVCAVNRLVCRISWKCKSIQCLQSWLLVLKHCRIIIPAGCGACDWRAVVFDNAPCLLMQVYTHAVLLHNSVTLQLGLWEGVWFWVRIRVMVIVRCRFGVPVRDCYHYQQPTSIYSTKFILTWTAEKIKVNIKIRNVTLMLTGNAYQSWEQNSLW